MHLIDPPDFIALVKILNPIFPKIFPTSFRVISYLVSGLSVP